MMKITYWIVARAIIDLFFGLGLLLMPVTVGAIFGFTLDPAGVVMARFSGALLLFVFIVCWFARKASSSDVALRALVLGLFGCTAICFVVFLMATLSGVWNALGWFPVGLSVVFGLAFAYFLFIKRIQ